MGLTKEESSQIESHTTPWEMPRVSEKNTCAAPEYPSKEKEIQFPLYPLGFLVWFFSSLFLSSPPPLIHSPVTTWHRNRRSEEKGDSLDSSSKPKPLSSLPHCPKKRTQTPQQRLFLSLFFVLFCFFSLGLLVSSPLNPAGPTSQNLSFRFVTQTNLVPLLVTHYNECSLTFVVFFFFCPPLPRALYDFTSASSDLTLSLQFSVTSHSLSLKNLIPFYFAPSFLV